MKLILCNSPLPPLHPTSSNTANLPKNINLLTNNNNIKWSNNTLSASFTAAALSFTLLISSPFPSIALDSPPPPINPPSIENCREDETVEQADRDSQGVVTNQGIVEEAWQIVYDSFLDANKHRWSPQLWMQKKEDILGSAVQSRAKAHDIIRRMLGSLGDPYTRFLTPDEFSKMARYDITGIGVNLREISDESGDIKLKVLGLVLDGPAHAAGVRQGDEVLAVNGVNVKGKSAFEVSSMLQGPNETSVTIKIKHGKCGPLQSLEIQRQLAARTPVFYRMEQAADGATSVGYIRLKEFNALAKKDLVIAIKRLQDMGASYFILDLRDNLGGLVQGGIEISKLFLDEGQKVIYTAGRDPQYQNTIIADSAAMVTSPVIVLVNNKTASASEIVASALHDNCKAILVGEKTYGKGLIQSVFELHDGSGVVVTVGKYVTPKHMDINGNGLKPDYRYLPAWSDVVERLSKCNMFQQG